METTRWLEMSDAHVTDSGDTPRVPSEKKVFMLKLCR